MNLFMPQSSIWMQYLVSALTTTAAIKHTLVPLILVCHDNYQHQGVDWWHQGGLGDLSPQLPTKNNFLIRPNSIKLGGLREL